MVLKEIKKERVLEANKEMGSIELKQVICSR